MVSYYLRKVIATIRMAIFVACFAEKPEPGVVVFPGKVRTGPVWFDFGNPTLVHLGDQLFHVFLVRHLAVRGVEVWVATPSMPRLFTHLGAKIGTPEAVPRLIVSKNDVAPAARRLFPESTFLGIGYGGMKSRERVAVDIARLTLAELNKQDLNLGGGEEISYADINFSPDASDSVGIAKLRNLDPGKGILGWNSYIASGQWMGHWRRGLVNEKARQLHDEGYRIVQLGSKSERENDKAVTDFVDLDLRGEVSPEATFAFLTAPRVAGILSFDNFLVHVSMLANRKSWVVIRFWHRTDEFRARYLPFFPGKESLLVWWR